MKVYFSEYYEAHKDDMKVYFGEYYDAHKDEIQDYFREYYSAHMQEMKTAFKSHYMKHKYYAGMRQRYDLAEYKLLCSTTTFNVPLNIVYVILTLYTIIIQETFYIQTNKCT